MRNEKGQFLPGQSGNPSGRRPDEFAALARERSEEALQVCFEVMADVSARPTDRLKAAEIVLDRGLGRAPQSISIGREPEDSIENDIKRANEVLTVLLSRPRLVSGE